MVNVSKYTSPMDPMGIVGGWTTHLKNISQNGNFPQVGGEHEKYGISSKKKMERRGISSKKL